MEGAQGDPGCMEIFLGRAPSLCSGSCRFRGSLSLRRASDTTCPFGVAFHIPHAGRWLLWIRRPLAGGY